MKFYTLFQEAIFSLMRQTRSFNILISLGCVIPIEYFIFFPHTNFLSHIIPTKIPFFKVVNIHDVHCVCLTYRVWGEYSHAKCFQSNCKIRNLLSSPEARFQNLSFLTFRFTHFWVESFFNPLYRSCLT